MNNNQNILSDKKISRIDEILLKSKIIPILVEDDINNAFKAVEALLEGGITVIEVTLRTQKAFKISESILKKFPKMTVGIGTILNKAQLIEAFSIGAHFGVSPGLSKDLTDLILDDKIDFPYMPGVSNPSEIMACMKDSFLTLKCFPASSSGGIQFLKQMNSVFSTIKFCPTGGINQTNALDYLSLQNVISVGGSFVLPKEAINNKDWNSITRIAKLFSQKEN